MWARLPKIHVCTYFHIQSKILHVHMEQVQNLSHLLDIICTNWHHCLAQAYSVAPQSVEFPLALAEDNHGAFSSARRARVLAGKRGLLLFRRPTGGDVGRSDGRRVFLFILGSLSFSPHSTYILGGRVLMGLNRLLTRSSTCVSLGLKLAWLGNHSNSLPSG